MNVAVFCTEFGWKCQVKKNSKTSACKKKREFIHKADDMVAHKSSNKKGT